MFHVIYERHMSQNFYMTMINDGMCNMILYDVQELN